MYNIYAYVYNLFVISDIHHTIYINIESGYQITSSMEITNVV